MERRGDSLTGGLLGSRFLDRFERLFHNPRMKNRSRVKWHNDPACSLRVDSVATLRAQQVEIRRYNSAFSASEAVHRGSLGMHLNRGSEDLAAE